MQHRLQLTVLELHRQPGQGIPLQARTDPLVSRRLRIPGFLDIRHMKVVRLSATHTSRFSPHKISLVLIFVKRPKQHQDHSAVGRIMSIKEPPTQSVIEPATYQIVKQSVDRLHHRVPPSQTACHIITLIQLTTTHTVSNLILPVLENKTLKQGFKQKVNTKHQT